MRLRYVELILRANGHKVELGQGVAAVQRVYEAAQTKKAAATKVSDMTRRVGRLSRRGAPPQWQTKLKSSSTPPQPGEAPLRGKLTTRARLRILSSISAIAAARSPCVNGFDSRISQEK